MCGGNQSLEIVAALMEYAVDYYTTGFTIYWSRKATAYIKTAGFALSQGVNVAALMTGLATVKAPNPIMVAFTLIFANLSLSVDRMNGHADMATSHNACLAWSSRYWEVAVMVASSVLDHWGDSYTTPDATECRDTYYGHVA